MSGDVLVLLYIYFKSKSMGFGANSKKYKGKIGWGCNLIAED
jgi:hypothetical protein